MSKLREKSFYVKKICMDYRSVHATARSGDAIADYVRNGQHVDLKVSGSIGNIHVANGTSVDRVQRACEVELARMRQAFHGLAAELMQRLPSTGGRPVIGRGELSWRETRNWEDSSRGVLTIDPSRYTSSVHVTLPTENAADAFVLQQMLANEMANRETAIRDVYRRIGTDVEARKAR